jgi:hypothetical protein
VPHRAEVALEVDAHDVVEVVLAHVEEHPVAQEAGVVHEDVEPAPLLEAAPDHGERVVPIGDVAAVGHRVATRSADLVDHRVGRARLTLTREREPEVVHHDLHALPRQRERVRPTEAAPRAGDERDPSF